MEASKLSAIEEMARKSYNDYLGSEEYVDLVSVPVEVCRVWSNGEISLSRWGRIYRIVDPIKNLVIKHANMPCTYIDDNSDVMYYACVTQKNAEIISKMIHELNESVTESITESLAVYTCYDVAQLCTKFL